MAKQTIKITTTKRVKKYGDGTGYVKCNVCHGEGRVKAGYNKKKK